VLEGAFRPPACRRREGWPGRPGLTTLIADLKGDCHASFSTVRKFLRDVVGVSLSRGQLAEVSATLAGPDDELVAALPSPPALLPAGG
jgi:hypothetical protein